MNNQDEGLNEKIIKGFPLNYVPELGGVGKVLFSKMSHYGDAIAQIDGLTGEKDTYKSLLKRSIRTALTLKGKGITSEDIISICSLNHLNTCVPFLASLFLGVKSANLDPSISLEDTIHLLKQVHSKMIFVSTESVELIENALNLSQIDATIVVFGESKKHCQFSEFLQESPYENDFQPVTIHNVKETAVIFFSSGTTGLPKGICAPYSVVLYAPYLLTRMGCNPSIALTYTSLYWVTGVLFLLMCFLQKGCKLVLPQFDIEHVWELMEKYKPTFMFLPPIHSIMLYKKGRPEGIDTSQLETFYTGGSTMSKDQMIELRNVLPGTKVVSAYGQTEAIATLLAFDLTKPIDVKLSEEKPESCGRPIMALCYKIVDLETEELLGANKSGELRVKSPFQMNGYYEIDSSQAWDADGFIKTGDIAYYDEDHCFYIVDRIKEMFKFRSWHITPTKIEGILLKHPAIESTVVIGVPHPEDGDHPMAIVVLKESSTITDKEIERFVEERVDDRQRLRGGVRIVKKIFVTASSKVKRRDIRKMVIEGKL